ncbi:MAG: hypothetical protein FJ304_10250 [Planctomycetes bacterium]|nr:hypothetical protein [Planctomycetota bacterium]
MPRRAIPSLVLVLAAGQLVAAPVPPQPKPDDTVPDSAVRLVERRKIQKELKMTGDQRIAIVDGLADVEEAFEKKFNELGNNPNATDEMFAALDRAQRKAIDDVLANAVAKGLTAAQRGRLCQLDWRVRGAEAFSDPGVAKKLQLTDAQKKKAADASEHIRGEVNRYLQGEGNDDESKRRASLFAIRKERLKELEGALTDDQKTAWATLLGPAPTGFDVDDLWLRTEEDKELIAVPELGK